MRVLITGGRDFRDWKKACSAFDYWHLRLDITLVIQGGQVSRDPRDQEKWGGDYYAKKWAGLRGIPVVEERVTDEEWKKFDRDAGPMRNRRMIDRHKPEKVIALPGGKGTQDMLNQARACGIRCIEVV